jgi:hypothetical protein
MAVVPAAVCLIAYYSWQLTYAASFYGSVAGQFSFSLTDILETAQLLFGQSGQTYHQQSVNLFLEQIASLPLVSYLPFGLSYLTLAILSMAVVAALAVFRKRRAGVILLVFQLLVSLSYAYAMMTLYAFSFSAADALSLPSFERYINTGLTVLYVSTLFFAARCLFDSPARASERTTLLSLSAAMLLFAVCVVACPAVFSQFASHRPVFADACREVSRLFSDELEAGDSVFIVNQGASEADNLLICYYSDGIRVNRGAASFSAVEGVSYDASTQTFIDLSKDYEYFYFMHLDSGFLENYGQLFSKDLKEGVLYHVDSVHENGTGSSTFELS